MKNQQLTNQKVDRSTTKIVDQNRRRIANLGAPVDAADAIRLQDLQDLEDRVKASLEKLGGTL